MKKIIFLVSCIFFIPIFSAIDAQAEFHIGFNLGLSTPNDKINDVYNGEKLSWDSLSNNNVLHESIKSGYHIGMRLRLPLDEDGSYTFIGGIAFHRFPESNIIIINPKDNTPLATLKTMQNVVPITVGINAYLFKSILGLYVNGELTYNYIANSVDIDSEISVPFKYSLSPSDSRVGFGLGAGFDMNLKLITLNLEARYNMINLIGRETDEGTKSYLSLSFGVFF
ncbi:MAG: b-brl protein [Bacteroidota bacterium]|nr:b-brl protein [Bacteroidota bacterium]